VQRDLERKGAPGDLAWTVIGYGAVGGFVGARLLFLAHHWDTFVAAPLQLLGANGGFVWYGGVLGGVLATAWPIRRAGVPWANAADSAAIGIAAGYGIGRIGCHLAGDGDWGTPTALPWGVAYPHGIAAWPHPPGVLVHPTPLYEAAASCVIAAALWGLRSKVGPPGALLAAYLVLAGTERFVVEIVRTSPRLAFGLTEAQWTSLALILAGGFWLVGHVRPVATPGRGVSPP
jgi:phosphatidylglycerol:prolipoprotein diacylglycerol transferase